MKKFTILILLLVVSAGSMVAQTLTVSGKVTDERGEPLIGAVVEVVGTSNANISLPDGTYTLRNVAQGATIRASYLGLETAESSATSETMNFVLRSSAQQIEQIVVTGMQAVDRRMFTGASDRLVAADVKLDGVGEISRGLEGRSAGVSVQNVSGTFGAAPKIRVRGATSIFGDSKPLWVVDGVIMEDVVNVDANALSSGDATTLISSAIAGLNADDIESFQILKDGSATSIYGARAMAGVIVITTKKGTPGLTKISYTGEFTMRLVPSYSQFNIMNSQDQMAVYQEMYDKGWLNYTGQVYRSQGGVYSKMAQLINTYNPTTGRFEVENTPEGMNAYLRGAERRNTDWFKELFRPSVQQQHSVSVSSGSERGSYYASLSAMVDPGWSVQSRVNRYTALFNTTQKIIPNLDVNIIGNASYRDQRAPGSLSSNIDVLNGTVGRSFDINPYSYSLNSSRTLDPDEYYTRNYAPFNIRDELSKNYMDINVIDAKFQAELKWKPLKKLELAALGAVKYQASSTEHHVLDRSNQAEAYRAMGNMVIREGNSYLYDNPDLPAEYQYSILPEGGIYRRNDFRALSYDFRATANYNDTFNRKHIVNAFGAIEINALNRRATNFTGWGMQYDMGESPYYILDLFKKQIEDNTAYYGMDNTSERNVAFAGTASYSYDYRYTINGTLRYEGSNRLGRTRSARWLPTWNIAGKWAVDREAFFEKLEPAISSLSLRLSYSLTADRGPSWVTNSRVVVSPSSPWRISTGVTESALSISQPENSELTYEKKHELNAGFDIGFVGDRISLSVDGYTRNNYDLIGLMITSGMSGVVSQWGNVAAMTSSGVELSLHTRNIEKENFRWATNFIFSYMNNEVTRLNSRTRVFDYLTGGGYSMVGYPRGAIFSLPFTGLNELGVPTFRDVEGNITMTNLNYQSTDYRNLLYEGPADPTITGSFGNILNYKGFTLNVFMTYSFGNVVRLDPVFSNSYSDLSATPNEFKDRWVNPGDEARTNIPVIASTRLNDQIDNLELAYSGYNYSNLRVAKGDFIRMKEISLSYDFPESVCRKLRMSNLSLKMQGTNLFLLYADKKLQGQDPEFFNTGGVATPMPKQFTLTLRIGF
jgi:TonB-linked SusC/RagA family outer membrane protein